MSCYRAILLPATPPPHHVRRPVTTTPRRLLPAYAMVDAIIYGVAV